MRVALDARWIQVRPLGGVGRGIEGILPRLREQVDLELLTAADLPAPEVDLPVHALATPWPHVATAWLQWSAPRWLKGFDGIFHCPWYALPVRQPVPMVVTLHDLSFETNPEWFRWGRSQSFSAQARWAARTAQVVVTVSHHVADQIMARYGVPAGRIVIAPNAVDDRFRPGRDATAASTRIGVTRPYVVALGGAPRRRLDVAIEAWRNVRDVEGIDLIVLGTADLPNEPGLAGGFLSDEDYVDLLGGAQALIYPTADEGFGMPALEAAACGVPVVCARVGALPEVLGEAAAWSAGLDAASFSATLSSVLGSAEARASLSAAGLQRAASHATWRDSADCYLAAYEQAAR